MTSCTEHDQLSGHALLPMATYQGKSYIILMPLQQFLWASHDYRLGISPLAHLSCMKESPQLSGSLATSLYSTPRALVTARRAFSGEFLVAHSPNSVADGKILRCRA